MVTKAPKSYPIKGGKLGRDRLSVIARVLEPTTRELFERVGIRPGRTVLDVGCGGGQVSLMLAKRVGPKGHVTGIDFDEEKIALARAEAEAQGTSHTRFISADVTAPWAIGPVDLVYARFILTHLADPQGLLAQAMAALEPGGMILVEDIDIAGYFSYPDCPAVTAYAELYMTLSRRRGGNPIIGRSLDILLETAGFKDVETTLVQPFSRKGEAKEVAILTFAAVADAIKAEGLASADEIARISRELEAFSRRSDTIISLPRIFQAWGRKG